MKGHTSSKSRKIIWFFIYAAIFTAVFAASAYIKAVYNPLDTEMKQSWDKKPGRIYKNLSYGAKGANKFDLYLPALKHKKKYGLIVYLHAGGFTSGDKSDDQTILKWFCSKGYVAAGINYSLHTDKSPASVYSQSMEIKQAMPRVVKEAEKLGFNLNAMAVSGGSAGGTLAMLYGYRDAHYAPIPVRLMFQMVGPPSFFAEDWDTYGLDKNKQAAAGLFGVMLGSEIDKNIIGTEQLQDKIKPISAYAWVTENTVPSVMIYGKHDKFCPFKSVRHLVGRLEEHNVDYKYFEAQHSGHGIQNDTELYRIFISTVEDYLDKYLPVQQ